MSDDDALLKIFVKTPDGQTHEIPALAGWTVMEIIRDAGLPIKAECGGAMACATCHIYVDPSWMGKLVPPREDERDLVIDHAFEPSPLSRLSCQIVMREDLDGLIVTLAPNPA